MAAILSRGDELKNVFHGGTIGNTASLTLLILFEEQDKKNNRQHIDSPGDSELTHWGRVTHICVNKLTIIGSDNGLSPGRRQAIIWTNDWILLIGPLGTNFSDILIEI